MLLLLSDAGEKELISPRHDDARQDDDDNNAGVSFATAAAAWNYAQLQLSIQSHLNYIPIALPLESSGVIVDGWGVKRQVADGWIESTPRNTSIVLVRT